MSTENKTLIPLGLLAILVVITLGIWFCPITYLVMGRVNETILDSVPLLPNAYDVSEGTQFVYDGWSKNYRVDIGAVESVQEYEQLLTESGWRVRKQSWISPTGTVRNCLDINKFFINAHITIITPPDGSKSVVGIYIPPAMYPSCDLD